MMDISTYPRYALMTSSTQQSIVNDIRLIEIRKVSADFNSIDDYNVFKYSLLWVIPPFLALTKSRVKRP